MSDPHDPLTGTTDAAPHDAADAEVAVDHIIGMSFAKTTRADEVLLALGHLAVEGQIAIVDAVVVRKGENGRVQVRQTVDPSPGRGALSGSMWGALAGLLFGGPALGLLVGAAGGGLLAKLVDVGLDDGWVKQVGEWLDPGTSALLLLVGDEVRPVVLDELGRYEGQVLYCTFPDAVRRELEGALGRGDVRPEAVVDHEPPAAPAEDAVR